MSHRPPCPRPVIGFVALLRIEAKKLVDMEQYASMPVCQAEDGDGQVWRLDGLDPACQLSLELRSIDLPQLVGSFFVVLGKFADLSGRNSGMIDRVIHRGNGQDHSFKWDALVRTADKTKLQGVSWRIPPEMGQSPMPLK